MTSSASCTACCILFLIASFSCPSPASSFTPSHPPTTSLSFPLNPSHPYAPSITSPLYTSHLRPLTIPLPHPLLHSTHQTFSLKQISDVILGYA
jgi:hypothetical protein